MKKIGAIGGSVGAVSAFIAFQIVGWMGALFVLVFGMIIFTAITISYTEFEILE